MGANVSWDGELSAVVSAGRTEIRRGTLEMVLYVF